MFQQGWGCGLGGRSFVKGHPLILELDLFAPPVLLDADKQESKELVLQYTDNTGTARITGSEFLKGSQSYPQRRLE